MKEWVIISKRQISEGVMQPATSGGLIRPGRWKYAVRNAKTGEEKTVVAQDEYDPGDKVSEDDFEET